MDTEYTHIAVLLDRTGSMEVIRDDTVGGFNAFLAQQQAAPGKATLTLVQFDSQDPYEVLQRFAPLAQVPPLTADSYVPRAATPLLDAMGRAIIDLGRHLDALPVAVRPARVIMVVITDGHENAFVEFRKAQVAQLVAEGQSAGWEFVFLGADLAGIADAHAVGVRDVNTLAFRRDAGGASAAYESLSDNLTARRSGLKRDMSFTDEDRGKQR